MKKIKKISQGRKSKIIKCKRCNRLRKSHAKGLCNVCYKNYGTKWVICKQCKEKKNHMARGFCGNCYRKLFYYDNTKASNLRRYYGDISFELWKEITKACYSCGFNKIVEMHHIDENRRNNARENLVGLCPNCHRMLHMEKYRLKMIKKLEKKGVIY